MARFDVGDIVALPYQAAEFDCVIDMHCLMCLPSEVAKEAVANIRRVLKPNGRLFSVTPRRGSWGDGIGRQIAPGTFADAPDGPYAHMGIARFTDEDDIRAVYEGFSTLKIDVVERTEQGRKYTVSFWTITCEV
jgi:SAM-dependent methyltransferase